MAESEESGSAKLAKGKINRTLRYSLRLNFFLMCQTSSIHSQQLKTLNRRNSSTRLCSVNAGIGRVMKNRLRITGFLIILQLVASGCSRGVPIVGLDEKGNERFFQIYEEKFSEEAGKAVNSIGRAVAAAEKQNQSRNQSSGLDLHLISVGLGVVGGIDVKPAPIVLLVQPRIRFLFTDLDNPQAP